MRMIRYSSLLFFFILVCFGTANAQWQITFGPYGFGFVRVQCFAKQGTNLFAGTQGDGVWISTDNSASSWTKVSNGITGKSVKALLVNGADLFALLHPRCRRQHVQHAEHVGHLSSQAHVRVGGIAGRSESYSEDQ